jgi:hypothetical protein
MPVGQQPFLGRFYELLERVFKKRIFGRLADISSRVTKNEVEQDLFVDHLSFLLKMRSLGLPVVRNLGSRDLLFEWNEIYAGVPIDCGFISRGPFNPETLAVENRGYELVSKKELNRLRTYDRFKDMEPKEVYFLFHLTYSAGILYQLSPGAKTLHDRIESEIEMFTRCPGYQVGELLSREIETVREKFSQHIHKEAKRTLSKSDTPHWLPIDPRIIGDLDDNEQLDVWKRTRDTWLAFFSYGGVDDLYLEKRLATDLPDFRFSSRKDLGGRWRGDVPLEVQREVEKMYGEVRFHKPSKQPVLAIKWPYSFSGTRFSRWVVKDLTFAIEDKQGATPKVPSNDGLDQTVPH